MPAKKAKAKSKAGSTKKAAAKKKTKKLKVGMKLGDAHVKCTGSAG